jgi:tetratricopeptide (TPR) repeat protein
VIYGDIGQRERAIADYDEAIRLDPKYATAYYNRGVIYGDIGQRERAIADYDEAIRLDPTLAQAWFNKGAVYANIGRLQEALACFERAYQLGDSTASGAIQHVKQMMGNTTIPVPQNDPQVAFEAFQRVTSLDAMRHVVAQYPILKDMIQTIQKTIQTQVPPELKPEFETRLAWLIQIAKGD